MNKESCDAKWYPSFRDNWDDLLFRKYILEHLHPETTLLDVGAGAGDEDMQHLGGAEAVDDADAGGVAPAGEGGERQGLAGGDAFLQ